MDNNASKEYKVIALYGSPRRGGNTDVLLNRFIEGLKSSARFSTGSGPILNIEKIIISNLKISPCRECRHCSIDGECSVNDEMQQIYPKMMDCDLLLIASPVFFTSVSGYLKAFIDRFQRFWALKYELDKKIINKTGRKGILLSCAGSKPPDIFDCTKKITRALFDVLYIKYYADFLYNSIDFKGDILKNPDDLKRVYEFAKTGEFI
ncbi:MAG TPA: flavodoxin family protein [Candidatus Humimicrobiaceae bacterium]